MTTQGRLLIVTAPSGSGKTTIVRHLLATFPDLRFSTSATNRKRRASEVNGRDYYFISDERFRVLMERDAFLEWEEVYPGQYYGTLRSEVDRLLAEGRNVIFDIDVKGAARLKALYGANALALFVRPPSLEILVRRLTQRQTEDAASLTRRIERVREEMSWESRFDRTLINDRLDAALSEADGLARSFFEKGTW